MRRRVTYIVALLLPLLCGGCTNLVFQPMRQHVVDPRIYGVVLEDRSFATEDGIIIHGWWLPARQTDGQAAPRQARGTVIFLHGNAQNISTHIASVHWLPGAGYNVYLYDYRGYGKSGGVPDYAWARRDLARAVEFVAGLPDAQGQPLFVFGQSLGGAIALSALGGDPGQAVRARLAGIIVEGAPTSLRQIAREALGRHWLTWAFQYPLSWLIDDTASPRERIGALPPTPLLLAHSRNDRVVPFHHGEALRAAAPAGSVWLPVSGPHIAAFAQPAGRQVLLEFLAAPPVTQTRASER